MKKTAIASALALGLGFGTAYAVPVVVTGATFQMYDASGAAMAPDNNVTLTYDTDAMTWGVSSPTVFFGLNWTASGGVLYGPGTYTVAINGDGADEVTNAAAPLADSDGFYEFTVPTGSIGGNINFAWGATSGIDVFMVWSADGLTSLDVDSDGTPGARMVDGPFPGFSANFTGSSGPTPPVVDTTPPVIDLGAAPTSVAEGAAWTETATCTDDVDGPITTGAGFTITGTVNTAIPGTYPISYSCTDSAGNTANESRTVTVVPAGVPVITVLGPNPQNLEATATPYADPGATCEDAPDGTISPGANFTTTGTVDATVPATYTITYSCTDADSNTTTATRTVEVTPPTTPPTITLTPTCPIVVMAGAADPTPSATAQDALGTAVAVTSTGTVDTNPTFAANDLSLSTTLTFSATDTFANTTIENCEVVVGNPTPVVTLTGSTNVTVNEGDGYSDPGATCQDFNVTAPDTPDTLTTVTPDITIDASTPAGSHTITYSCTDADSNTATATRTVVVVAQGGGGGSVTTSTTGNNFTMLDPTGAIVGGTNDVTFSWDGTLNTVFQDNGAGTNATLASSAPFFGQQWRAYNVSIYGPGTYTISTADSPGSTDCPFGLPDCVSGGDYTVTVGANQIMAHMKFAWGTTEGIDVVNVWEAGQVFAPSAMFTDAPRTADPWSGNVNAFWAFMSSDWDGDTMNGGGMIDGPFPGFNANFNVMVFSDAYQYAGNNFTMLDPTGAIVGGTNDVTFTWDGTLNTAFQDNGAGTNATLASSAPFFGQQWRAYNVSIYGPGTYTISTADSPGSTDCPFGLPDCVSGGDYTVTVGANQIMAHMKFAWGTTEGIDVVNIWEAGQFAPSAMFTDAPRTTDPWSGNADTFWAFMSSDWDGDNMNGGGMIDGPFPGFNANFNVVAVSAGASGTPPDRTVGEITIDDPGFGGGAAAGWWTLAGLLGLLGMRRRAMGH